MNGKIIINTFFFVIIIIIIIIYSYFKLNAIPDYWIINSVDQGNGTIEYITNRGNYTLRKIQEYNVNSLIIKKKNYIKDKNGDLIPFDFVLGWDKMYNKNKSAYIDFSQKQRWYYYKIYDIKKLNIPYNDVGFMTANTHIIPDSEFIFKELVKIKEGENIELKGYLVNVTDNKNGYTLNTSISESDTGSSACEIFYITEIYKK